MNSVQYKLFLAHPSLFPFSGHGGSNVDICRSGNQSYNYLNNISVGEKIKLVFDKINLTDLYNFNKDKVEITNFYKIVKKLKQGNKTKYLYQTIDFNEWSYEYNKVIDALDKINYEIEIKKGVFEKNTQDIDFSCTKSGCTFVESSCNPIIFDLLNLLINPINSPSFNFAVGAGLKVLINLQDLKDKDYKQNDDISFVLDKIDNISNTVLAIDDGSVPHNLLLKGVPGTGKSRTIDNLIQKLNASPEQVLRINIHNGTNNSDLMQGIAVKTGEGNSGIIYSEKQGAVLQHLLNAVVNPDKKYVLVLEEIQENSLNKIIGDLIYLIEDSKRTIVEPNDVQDYYNKPYDLIEKLIHFGKTKGSIKIPSLVENEKPKNLIVPDNFYVFCTSNYRDDRKVIEDNLLRRFDVVEIYPDVDAVHVDKQDFFMSLNNAIEKVMATQDTHPDRFTIGHANWISETTIDKPLLKTVIEFKDVKNIPFDIVKQILEIVDCGDYKIKTVDDETKLLKDYCSYKDLITDLQNIVYCDLIKK